LNVVAHGASRSIMSAIALKIPLFQRLEAFAIQHPSVISKLLGQAAARLTAFDWQNGSSVVR